jgi:SPP1 gp7 family putative phage head morphogenesis protein
MAITNLIESLTAFLEASTAAQKWRVVRPMEAKLQKDMRKAFTAQGDAFLDGFAQERSQFSEALTQTDWITIFDQAAALTYELFLDPLEATAIAGLTAGAGAVIADLDLGISFNLANPRAVAYVNQHGAQNVRGINDTTRSYLQTVITQGVDEGWSYARMAKAIKDRYAEFAVGVPQQHIRSRAELIAVSETGNAYENGSNIVVRDLQDAGLVMEKSWLTVNDNRVDPHCLANEAQGWIPFDEAFSDGSMHPLSHPACRCTALYRRAP